MSTQHARRVFVVEDDPLIRTVVRMALTDAGYEIGETPFGTGADAAIRAFRPDVVLLDLALPDELGTDVLARLREHPDTRNLAVIGATGALTNPGSSSALRTFTDVLMKPYTMTDLLDVIERHLPPRDPAPPF